MKVFNHMITYLQNKPIVGVIAGFSSGIFATLREFLTDDSVIKNITVAGVWLGFMIAILTGIIKSIELIRIVKGKK